MFRYYGYGMNGSVGYIFSTFIISVHDHYVIDCYDILVPLLVRILYNSNTIYLWRW
jgi:hypothetical protein